MKVMKKVLIIVLLIVLSLAFIQSTAMAYNWDQKIEAAGKTTAPAGANKAITATRTVSQSIITIARVISMGVAITMLIVLAMKYMMAAPGEKASIKKSAVTYVVGAVVMFAAYGILTIIQEFAKGVK